MQAPYNVTQNTSTTSRLKNIFRAEKASGWTQQGALQHSTADDQTATTETLCTSVVPDLDNSQNMAQDNGSEDVEEAVLEAAMNMDSDNIDVDQPANANSTPDPLTPSPPNLPNERVLVASKAVEGALLLAAVAAIELDHAEVLEHSAILKHKETAARGKAASEAVITALASVKVAKEAAAQLPVTVLCDAAMHAEATVAAMLKLALLAATEMNVTEAKMKEATATREIAETHACECSVAAILEMEAARAIREDVPGADESEDGAIVDGNDGNDKEDTTSQTPSDPSNSEDKKHAANSTAPNMVAAQSALEDIKGELKPRRKNGKGYMDPRLDLLTHNHLEMMKSCLWIYVDPTGAESWIAASQHAAHAAQRGPYFARKLREWVRTYIDDCTIPENQYGTWNESILDHEDLAQELKMHLQSIGKYVTANDIVCYLNEADVQQCWKIKKTISLSMAQRWMR